MKTEGEIIFTIFYFDKLAFGHLTFSKLLRNRILNNNKELDNNLYVVEQVDL